MADVSDDPRADRSGGAEGLPLFRFFPFLPAELRLRIWQLSFEPRIVELHARLAHYADDYKHGGEALWQSGCTNPAALSVSVEARASALEHYTVCLPLAAVASSERVGGTMVYLHRVLYLCLAADTVVVLGNLDLDRTAVLLASLRRRDPAGDGLRRLAISARGTYHAGAGAILRVLARTMFRDLDELVVFMSGEHVPPAHWTGGVCLLEDCSSTDYYKRYVMSVGQELMDGDRWMVVGKKELRVMDLGFRPGW